MRMDIKSSGLTLTAALIEHAERRLRFALTRSHDRILRVAVLVGDSNGPRGGTDKFCRIRVLLKKAPEVLIEDTDAELYAAIDRAAERAGRNVTKRLDKLKASVRPTGLKPLSSLPADASDTTEN